MIQWLSEKPENVDKNEEDILQLLLVRKRMNDDRKIVQCVIFHFYFSS